jgi:hypothetical protein
VPWYVRDEAGRFCDLVGLAIRRAEVWVPSLWRPELASAIINAERRRRLTAQQRMAILQISGNPKLG